MSTENAKLELPPAPKPAGNYVPAVRVGNLLYISGMLPLHDGKISHEGPVGVTCSVEEAYRAARNCALNILAVARQELGDIEKIQRVVQLQGFVFGEPGFPDSPKIINGASDLMVEALGERGKHTRAAVTVAGLPLRAAVEVMAILQVKD